MRMMAMVLAYHQHQSEASETSKATHPGTDSFLWLDNGDPLLKRTAGAETEAIQ